MLAIKTENLSKKYKERLVVDKINLSIEEGKLFSLLGVNGAGKTTTIKMLSCLIKPTQGNAFIHGFNVQTQSIKAKEIINVSPQETAVAPNLTVKENLELVCGLYGDNKKISKEKAEKIIQQFSFEEIKNQKARTLSGGWQRRLSIAMAIISEPQVLFLDEPTLGLDVIARRELWSVIEKLKSKMTIILTTHYLEEAEALSDEIGIMSKGKLIAVGNAQELKNQAGIDDFEEAFISLCQKGEN